MGKIYFNPKTGEFWKASRRRRMPPEGYKYTGYKDYYGCTVAKSYYCPTCNEYHAYITIIDYMPLHAEMLMEWTAKIGCREASKLVKLARSLGGREEHYEYVWKLREMGLIEKWMTILPLLNSRVRIQVIKRLLKGENEDNVYAWAISRQLH